MRGIVDRSTDPDLLRTELFIGGEWTSGCRDRIEVREPATELKYLCIDGLTHRRNAT